jgi:hypothetical protein
MDLVSEPLCQSCRLENESAFHFTCFCPARSLLRAKIFGKPALNLKTTRDRVPQVKKRVGIPVKSCLILEICDFCRIGESTTDASGHDNIDQNIFFTKAFKRAFISYTGAAVILEKAYFFEKIPRQG